MPLTTEAFSASYVCWYEVTGPPVGVTTISYAAPGSCPVSGTLMAPLVTVRDPDQMVVGADTACRRPESGVESTVTATDEPKPLRFFTDTELSPVAPPTTAVRILRVVSSEAMPSCRPFWATDTMLPVMSPYHL